MLLTLLFAALSGIATAWLWVFCPALSFWWCPLIWLGSFLALCIAYIVLLLICFRLLPDRDPSPRRRHITHRIIEITLDWVLLLLGMRVQVQGLEQLPHRPYLLVGNHRYAFDPMCTEVALGGVNMVFIAKPGVFKIPVIAPILRRLRFLPIDRENARNAVTTIKRAAELIRDLDLCVGIYPEGTRSKDGNLLSFHAGSFKIAKLADCPIVVATIRYERVFLWCKRVHLHVVDVMSEEVVKENNTAALSERAEQAIRKDLTL